MPSVGGEVMRPWTSFGILAAHLAVYLVLVAGFDVQPWPWLLLGLPASASLVAFFVLRRRRLAGEAGNSELDRFLGRVAHIYQPMLLLIATYASCSAHYELTVGSGRGLSVSLLLLVSMSLLLWSGRLSQTARS